MEGNKDFTLNISVSNGKSKLTVSGEASEYQQANILVQYAAEALIKAGYNPQDTARLVDQMVAWHTLSEDEFNITYWTSDSETDEGTVGWEEMERLFGKPGKDQELGPSE